MEMFQLLYDIKVGLVNYRYPVKSSTIPTVKE